MLKKIAAVVAVLLLLLTAAFFYAAFHLGSHIKQIAETYGSKMLGADVSVEKVSVNLISGDIFISGLKIGPPPKISKITWFTSKTHM